MWRKVIMAGTNKIATNKWIKDNLFLGYSIPKDQDYKCPTKSEIYKNSQNLISFKGGENNQCMTQENLVTGVNTKTASLSVWTNFEISWFRLETLDSSGNVIDIITEFNPDGTGVSSTNFYPSIKSNSVYLGYYINPRTSHKGQERTRFILNNGSFSSYTYFQVEGGARINTWNKYNIWLGGISSPSIYIDVEEVD